MGKVYAQIFYKEEVAQAVVPVVFHPSRNWGDCNRSRFLFSHMKNGEEKFYNFYNLAECCEDLMSYLCNVRLKEFSQDQSSPSGRGYWKEHAADLRIPNGHMVLVTQLAIAMRGLKMSETCVLNYFAQELR